MTHRNSLALFLGLASLLGLGIACSSEGDLGADDASTGGSLDGNVDGNPSTGGTTGTGGSTMGNESGGTNGSGGQVGSPRDACKRGIAYGHHSQADFARVSPAVSWWYNWAYVPDEALRDGSYADADVAYVPMVWGGEFDDAAITNGIPAGATALLGFNEPNFGEQSNLSAQQAAALWPRVEAIADARGLLLVSPAVNFCGGNCQDTNPFDYLDDFFAACTGCRVDHVAFHIYVGCNQNGDNHAQWLIDHVETYKARFSQPLWLTEFACTDAANFDEQKNFLEDAVAYLENDARIERYSWFSGRFPGMQYVDLLGADGQLTSLGEAYVNAPKNSACAD